MSLFWSQIKKLPQNFLSSGHVFGRIVICILVKIGYPDNSWDMFHKYLTMQIKRKLEERPPPPSLSKSQFFTWISEV